MTSNTPAKTQIHPAVPGPWRSVLWRIVVLGTLGLSGCTSWSDYVRQGFKVGPNYSRPSAPVAQSWIDAADARVRSEAGDDRQWWTTFHDPALNELIQNAYQQNLTLREAGYRVLEARAQLGISVGELFPQTQMNTGDYTRSVLSQNVANREMLGQRTYSQWDYGFGLAWELDFWGRLRRAIESSEATLDASIEQYDDVLVTLLGDLGTYYVQYRTTEQRISYAEENLQLQRKILELATARFKGGQTSELDVNQAQSELSTTEALLPKLRIQLRNANNRLCVLLGAPPENLQSVLGPGSIPSAPSNVAVGIPADLLRRRPDVRRAERQAAAQCAQIGIAQADFYPQFLIDGSVGWSSQSASNLISGRSFTGSVGPEFRWQILNYGRILNNVRGQDARFLELVATYQQTVLQANEEVENGLARFLESQLEVQALTTAVSAAKKSVDEGIAQYQGGLTDFNRVAVLQQRLIQSEEQLAQAQGEIAQGLVSIYRALGGGWQIRLAPPAQAVAQADAPG